MVEAKASAAKLHAKARTVSANFSTTDLSQSIETLILELLKARSIGASVCPSEVARALHPEQWRTSMNEVRAVAARMALKGKLRITQSDTQLDPERVLQGLVRGPIRLRLPK